MSADNGIYVLATIRKYTSQHVAGSRLNAVAPVWRVALTNAIADFEHMEVRFPNRVGDYLKEVWGTSATFNTLETALMQAYHLSKDTPTEYGISVIDKSTLYFPGDE